MRSWSFYAKWAIGAHDCITMVIKQSQYLFRKITQSLNTNYWSVARQLWKLIKQLFHNLSTREVQMNKENISALDRELFTEFIESPIHPLLINMVRPYVDSCDYKFRLQINGEAFSHWREVRGYPSTALMSFKQASPSWIQAGGIRSRSCWSRHRHEH